MKWPQTDKNQLQCVFVSVPEGPLCHILYLGTTVNCLCCAWLQDLTSVSVDIQTEQTLLTDWFLKVRVLDEDVTWDCVVQAVPAEQVPRREGTLIQVGPDVTCRHDVVPHLKVRNVPFKRVICVESTFKLVLLLTDDDAHFTTYHVVFSHQPVGGTESIKPQLCQPGLRIPGPADWIPVQQVEWQFYRVVGIPACVDLERSVTFLAQH